MSDSRVTFNKDGNWSKGGDLKDMDVKRTSPESPAEPSAPPSAIPDKTAKVPPPPTGGFSLESLRTRVGKKTEEAPAPQPVPEPASVKKEEASVEIPESSAVEKVGQEATTPTVVEEAEEAKQEAQPPVQQESAPEPVTESVTESAPVVSPKAAFSLSQMGLTSTSKENTEEKKESTHTEFDMDKPAPAGEKMDLTSDSKMDTPPVQSGPAEHFNIVTAADMLSVPYGGETLNDTPQDIKDWILRVLKEFVRRPTALFTSKMHPELRAYALFYTHLRNGAVCVGLGKGADFTAVSYNSAKGVLVDMSGRLAISGNCVMAGDAPLAITSLIESNRTTAL